MSNRQWATTALLVAVLLIVWMFMSPSPGEVAKDDGENNTESLPSDALDLTEGDTEFTDTVDGIGEVLGSSLVDEGIDEVSLSNSNTRVRTTALLLPLYYDESCSKVVLTPKRVPETYKPIYKTLEDLLTRGEISDIDGVTYYNPLASHSRSLSLLDVSLDGETAIVYLTGNFASDDVCTNEGAVFSQINRAANHYESVSAVEVYLNGSLIQ